MLDQVFRVFNLNKKERLIFQSLLELGLQPASNVARKTNLARNTVRFVLDKLVEKGLCAKTNRGNTHFYQVEPPANIIRHLKIQQNHANSNFDAQIHLVKNLGSLLDSAQNSKINAPKITFYEGLSGLEKVYEHTLSAKETIRSWANFDGMHSTLPEYFDDYYQRRAKHKIWVKSIHPDSDLARQHQKKDSEEWRESVLVPPEKVNWVPEIQVYDEWVNIASWRENLGILIQSPQVADAMKAIFDFCFSAAKDAQNRRKKD